LRFHTFIRVSLEPVGQYRKLVRRCLIPVRKYLEIDDVSGTVPISPVPTALGKHRHKPLQVGLTSANRSPIHHAFHIAPTVIFRGIIPEEKPAIRPKHSN
jgi:hypothetical protein